MGKINWARVLLGGIVAGVVINICEYVMEGIWLKPDWDAALKALNRQMAPNATMGYIIMGFLVGIMAVATYAVARPRFGPGPRTAAVMGLAYWVIGYLLPNFGYSLTGLFPNRPMLISTIGGLVEIVLAVLAGAWLYKEG
jgi:hypothetical protein